MGAAAGVAEVEETGQRLCRFLYERCGRTLHVSSTTAHRPAAAGYLQLYRRILQSSGKGPLPARFPPWPWGPELCAAKPNPKKGVCLSKTECQLATAPLVSLPAAHETVFLERI